jgi:quinol monooxygenase YgiN
MKRGMLSEHQLQATLDSHFSMAYFQRFAATADDLLKEPLQLIFLEQVSA